MGGIQWAADAKTLTNSQGVPVTELLGGTPVLWMDEILFAPLGNQVQPGTFVGIYRGIIISQGVLGRAKWIS